MARYIDADKLSENLMKRVNNPAIKSWLLALINDTPTADVQEVRHGKWIDLHDEDVLYEQTYKCSVCGECFVLETGTPQENEYNYCPNAAQKWTERKMKNER